MDAPKMCEFCGIRPAIARCKDPQYAHRIPVKYCDVCRPIVRRELRLEALRTFRQRGKDECSPDPYLEGVEKPRQAFLKNIGLDYLGLKQAGLIRSVEFNESNPKESYG